MARLGDKAVLCCEISWIWIFVWLVTIGFCLFGGNDLNTGRPPYDVAADMSALKVAVYVGCIMLF